MFTGNTVQKVNRDISRSRDLTRRNGENKGREWRASVEEASKHSGKNTPVKQTPNV